MVMAPNENPEGSWIVEITGLKFPRIHLEMLVYFLWDQTGSIEVKNAIATAKV